MCYHITTKDFYELFRCFIIVGATLWQGEL